MKTTYSGGCHCGSVRWEVDLDLAAGTVKCNCSMCSKVRSWLAFVQPDEFRLLAGEEHLNDYQFGAKRLHHLFCRHCGIHTHGWGTLPSGPAYAVRLGCLEGVEDAELAAAPVRCIDGRNDNWSTPPAETRHL